jgi:surface polysaccharide O-acyltransferase-like enzyme
MVKDRNSTLDLFRLAASFFIILLHVNFFMGETQLPSFIRISARWAVPFFFLLSGYLIAPKVLSKDFSLKSIEKTILKVFKIILISNFIYILFTLYLGRNTNKPGILLSGSYYHLWFLPSLGLGILGTWMLRQLVKKRVRYLILFLITLAALYTDSYDQAIIGEDLSFYLFRFLTGYLFIELGILIKEKEEKLKTLISTKLLVILVLFTFFLQFLEILFLKSTFGVSLFNHQFIITTPILSSLIFSLAIRSNFQFGNISKTGQTHSLFIYLYHPILIFILNTVLNKLGLLEDMHIVGKLFIPVVIFLGALLIGKTLEKVTPSIFKVLNGDF